MKGTVLITGASSGIGLELARIHAKSCDHLILLARTQPKLDALKEELEGGNEYLKVDILAKDLSIPGSADEVYEMTSKKGIKLDYLINNAGFGDYGEYVDAKWEKIEGMMNLNMITLSRLTQLYAKDMVAAGSGRIMNVASVAAFVPGPLMAVYYATKAYVLHFSEAINNELKDTGVTVTALCPGPTASSFQVKAGFGENALHRAKDFSTPAAVAAFGHKAMLAGKAVAIHKFRNRIWVFFIRIAPRSQVVKFIRKLLERRRN